ncbi:MAG: GTPase HflX [Lachnospiraceae bacterium]|nr:GTPase HflX [Lachnospiraceae bacterium]
MQELIDIKEEQERVILVAVQLDSDDDTEESVDELKELADTAGALTVGRLIQKRERPQAGSYIGKGKIDELKDLIAETKATGIICDDELSPAQMRNLEAELQTKVMDRTMLILDIFAKHATTAEGKLQVEMAQLKYRVARLVGMRSSMSRVSYGIGMRGPGEKKLEMDRRLIRDRISRLGSELEAIEQNRSTNRVKRMKSGVPVAAIVGYTNAGKSTLLNRLTGADILTADMLFATLDPTTRVLKMESGQEILLTDTVGFIRKLPHNLIEAFKSTLEEACYADIIVHVVDASNPEAAEHMYVVYETLKKLGVKDKPVITLFNKSDIAGDVVLKDLNCEKSMKVSAATGEGLDVFLSTLEKILLESKVSIEAVIDYKDAGIITQIRKDGTLLEEKYLPEGIGVKAYVSKELYGRIKKYIDK